MKVENKVMPNEKQMEEFLEEGHDEPIYMVNLLKFKEKAEYPDKRETDLTGREAYACLLYTSPSPRDISGSRMPSSA